MLGANIGTILGLISLVVVITSQVLNYRQKSSGDVLAEGHTQLSEALQRVTLAESENTALKANLKECYRRCDDLRSERDFYERKWRALDGNGKPTK